MATYSNNTTLKVNTQNTLTTTLSLATTTVLTTGLNQYYEVEFRITGSATNSACNILINGVPIGFFIAVGAGASISSFSQAAGVAGVQANRLMLGPSSTLAVQVTSTSITWSHHATMFINTP
jgi:hypothetical protein